jgi:hypothetical protein
MIAMQSFEVLKILNSFEIKSDRISAECGLEPHPTGCMAVVKGISVAALKKKWSVLRCRSGEGRDER